MFDSRTLRITSDDGDVDFIESKEIKALKLNIRDS